jgi:hypothetical protein
MLFRALFRGGILGGIVAFLFSAFSWSVLPFHNNSLHFFENEQPLLEALADTQGPAGIYLLPSAMHLPSDLDVTDRAAMDAHQETIVKKMEEGPVAFLAFAPQGVNLYNPGYFLGTMLTYLLAAFCFTLMLWPLREKTFLQRWLTLMAAALAAAAIGHLPNAFMWHFGFAYTAAMIFDVIVGWGVAGLVIAWATGQQGSLFMVRTDALE